MLLGHYCLFYKEERSSDHLEKTGVPISTTERCKRCYSHIDTYTSTAKNIQLQQNILLNYGRGQKTDDDGAINPAQKGWLKKPGLLSEKKTHRRSKNQVCLFGHQTLPCKITFAVASYKPHSIKSHDKTKHCINALHLQSVFKHLPVATHGTS